MLRAEGQYDGLYVKKAAMLRAAMLLCCNERVGF